MADRAATIEYLKAELNALFPGRGVNVWAQRFVGEENIYIRYSHHAEEKDCPMKIRENDRAYMKFAIWNDRDGTYYIEHPTCHMGRVFDDKTVKFRKLRGKTEREAAEKLVAWFKKHREHILTVGAQS